MTMFETMTETLLAMFNCMYYLPMVTRTLATFDLIRNIIEQPAYTVPTAKQLNTHKYNSNITIK